MAEKRDPATQCCWPECANAPADMRILWDLPLLQANASAALEERHKIGCKRKGRVDFALFNIPRIAKFDACRQRA
jgi:hypothetical protein